MAQRTRELERREKVERRADRRCEYCRAPQLVTGVRYHLDRPKNPMVFVWIANSDFARRQAEIKSSFILRAMNSAQKRPGDWQTIGDDMRRALIMFEEIEQPEFGTLIW